MNSSFTPSEIRKSKLGNFESNLYFLEKSGLLDKKFKFLEIGSGAGAMVKELRDQGYDVVGIDIDEQAINLGKRMFGDLPINKMSGESLDFGDATFDVVFSLDVIEHLPDVGQHLKEVRRVLKPDGYYLIQTPNKWTNVLFEIYKRRSFSKYKEDHCSLHNYWQIKKRLKKFNFSFEFMDVPVANSFFKEKIKGRFGSFGLFLIRLINPDKMPVFLKTNFYLLAKKIN